MRPWRRLIYEGRQKGSSQTEVCPGGPGRPEMNTQPKAEGGKIGRQQGGDGRKVFV